MDAIANVESLMDVTRQTQEQLAVAIKIIKARDRQIDIAISALFDLSIAGNQSAGEALLAMKAEHDKLS